ncbi:MAG: LamG-like jellyroll fold domain-containing protein [Planctomycetota bacterium]
MGVKPGDVRYLRAPTSADVRLGPDYTIEAWVHPTGLAAWNRLVLNWGNEYAYHLAIRNGVLSLFHGQSDGKYVNADGGRIAAGRWYHVAGIARRNSEDPAASTLEVYLNGRLTATAPYDGTIRTLPNEGFGIGDAASGNGTAIRFRGYIDEVTVWRRALGPDDVARHYAKRADMLDRITVSARPKAATPPVGDVAREDPGVEEILFAERHPGRDKQRHYYANFGYSCVDADFWLHGADGGRLCRLTLRTGAVKPLLDDPGGAVRDPQLHYDAEKILFSYRRGGTHHYHLHEINIDGTGLKQLTDGPWDDVEPTYLPGGDIIFSSTRCKRYILCWIAQAATLHRCDADGQNIRMLSSNTVTENTPSVLPDGRVIYTRWEYVDRDPVVFHHLWSMNPDGTNQKAYFGNMYPGGVFIDAKAIPGTDEVLFINSPGHGRNEHEGHVAVVSDRNGPDDRASMRNITGGGFRDPYPLSQDTFLVARGSQILRLNAAGESQVIHQGAMMVHEPVPVRKRPRERVIPSRLDMSRDTATLVLNDVYVGRNMEGVARGTIRKLLVLEDLPKPANFHGGGSQPLGHGVTSTLKRILGTVPVETDGSAHFEVPAMRSIYVAALDGNDLSVKQMRSFMTLQPGEIVSCMGCHEPRTKTPVAGGQPTLQALNRPASRIAPFKSIPDIIDYPRDVQPILDRNCVKCHNPEKRKGNVVLTGDRGPVFSHSYYELFFQWQVKDTSGNPGDRSGRQKGNDKPNSTYSSASPLMKKIDGSHNKVVLSERDRTVIRLWIDVSAQYPGTVASIGTGQVGGCWDANKYVRVMAQGWPSTPPAVDAVKRRCVSCHQGSLPKHVTDTVKGLSFADMLSWERPLSRFSRHRIFNLSRPDKSLVLLAPLSRKAGGYAEGEAKQVRVKENRRAAPTPIKHATVFQSTDDPDYRKILTHMRAAKAKLEEIKRFDMAGFRPNEHYVREMKRYGVLPRSCDLAVDAIDVYATDRKYWESMWYSGSSGR